MFLVLALILNILPTTTFAATLSNGMAATYVIGQDDLDTGGFQITDDAHFGNPVYQVEIDEDGERLFVADQAGSRVLVFDVSSVTTGESAIHVLGQQDFVTINPQSTAVGMQSPHDVAYDAVNERLFVSDTGHNRVLVFDISAGITDAMAAVNVLGQDAFGQTQQNKGNGAPIAGGLNRPAGLEYDEGRGLLYVADNDTRRVVVFDVNVVTDGEDAIAVLGQDDFVTYSFGVVSAARFGSEDISLDVDNQLLFVADGLYNRVLVFDVDVITNGEDAINVIGQTDFTSSDPSVSEDGLTSPSGVTYESTNERLWIADQGANRIMVYDLSNGITDGMSAINVLGQADFVTGTSNVNGIEYDDGKGNVYRDPCDNCLSSPVDAKFDATSELLYVSDGSNNRIVVYDLSGAPVVTPEITYAGNFSESPDNDGTLAGSRIATIVDDTFVNAGGMLTVDTHYELDNVPGGLTPVMTVNGGGTTATLTFTGAANDHENADDVANLTITFLGGAFTNTATASDVTGYINTTGTIDFEDEEARSSSGSSVRYSCQDSNATNYRATGKSMPSLCRYDTDTEPVAESTTTSSITNISDILGSGLCSANLLVTNNMKQGDRDGQYSAYNGGTVTQVALLQTHINRILAAEYNQAAGPIDGIFGRLTKQGVERLQTALNTTLSLNPRLVLDGIVGPFTKAAINNSCGEIN